VPSEQRDFIATFKDSAVDADVVVVPYLCFLVFHLRNLLYLYSIIVRLGIADHRRSAALEYVSQLNGVNLK
jgi:hypothetical protein